MLEILESIFNYIVNIVIMVVELVCVAIIVYTVIKALIHLFKRKDDTRLAVSEGISLALEFKLGGEVLRTLVVRELSELLILGSIIVLMVALSIFVQWGIKNEHKNALYYKTLQSQKDQLDAFNQKTEQGGGKASASDFFAANDLLTEKDKRQETAVGLDETSSAPDKSLNKPQ